jgi:hypothetical protein
MKLWCNSDFDWFASNKLRNNYNYCKFSVTKVWTPRILLYLKHIEPILNYELQTEIKYMKSNFEI